MNLFKKFYFFVEIPQIFYQHFKRLKLLKKNKKIFFYFFFFLFCLKKKKETFQSVFWEQKKKNRSWIFFQHVLCHQQKNHVKNGFWLKRVDLVEKVVTSDCRIDGYQYWPTIFWHFALEFSFQLESKVGVYLKTL